MSQLGDMNPEELRRFGHEVADWVADFRRDIDRYRVLPEVEPGAMASRLPAAPPAQGEPMDRILADFRDIVVPATTHWNHPRFMAYFANSGSGPGILGETLAAALNVNAMLWRTCPAATELETLALDWLRQMLDLPAAFEGHINDTASVASLVALAAARERVTQGRARQEGMAGLPPLRIYASEQAHSSIEKAAIVLGLGQEGLRKIATDEEHRLRSDILAEAIETDLAAGDRPVAVVATVGTTATNGIDPVPAIADLCERHGLWLHVDAAYGGAMGIVPEYRWVLDGCARADSFVVNPHKWLMVPMDCSALYCRDIEGLRRAFSLVPPYLMTPEQGHASSLMDYGPAMGRRFRALKLWMVLRYFGVEGMIDRIRHHVELAKLFATWIDAAPQWERLAPVPMSTVVYRHRPSGLGAPEDLNAHNRTILERVNREGTVFLSHAELEGTFALRLTIGNAGTHREHVEAAWEALQRAAG